jgi:glycosyltransferase involved in cell wall biosynthesis
MDPLDVSVIIPTFHREKQLLEAIGSAQRQGGVTLEIIVVDDSPDASARDAVAALGDSRVRYVLRPQPSGGRPALVRNDGAKPIPSPPYRRRSTRRRRRAWPSA